MSTLPPWATGPGEILQHGLSLLEKDSDANRRLAMISIDNAVELMIKTYLTLPKRVTGDGLGRRKYLEISERFPELLDALEAHAVERVEGINLGEVEWFHQLRNALYHQGNGLTVERSKVEVYGELAKLLFRNLFDVSLDLKVTKTDVLGAFVESWVELERVIGKLSKAFKVHQAPSMLMNLKELTSMGLIDEPTVRDLEQLRLIRNQVIHGPGDYSDLIDYKTVERLQTITKRLEKEANKRHDSP